MNRVIVNLDIETGGLNPSTDAILEVCMKRFNGEILINTLVSNTSKLNINQTTLDVNNISLEETKKKGISDFALYNKLKTIFQKLQLEVNDIENEKNVSSQIVFTGKNVQFDLKFIEELFRRHNDELDSIIYRYRILEIDSLILAYEIRNKTLFSSLSMSNVCDFFNIQFEPHRAKNDVIANEKLLNKLINNKRTLKEIMFKVYSSNPQLIYYNADFHREVEKEAGHPINFLHFIEKKIQYLGKWKKK